jgi:hypothetical protein
MEKINRIGRIDLRLLELEIPFYDYVDLHQMKPRPLIRHFIKNGLKGNGGLSFEQHAILKNEIIELRKSMSRVGGNFNQIARYYNEHDFLNETELHKELKQSQADFRGVTSLLEEVLMMMR